MTIYDATAINEFRLCPEKYRQRHVLNLVREREEEAPKSGQAWHAAMRCWFDTASIALSPYERARGGLLRAWGPVPLLGDATAKRPLGLFQALLACYAEKWPRERDPFDVVRNEEWVEGLIPKQWSCWASGEYEGHEYPSFAYGGILDRLIRMDGRTYVMDTKTTSAHLNEAYFAQYMLSTQLRGYVALELVNGRECEGVYIDAVHVDTRYQKAKPEHLQRWGPHRYTQSQLSEWARDVERTIRQIEWLRANVPEGERWPQHDQACFKWHRACPYLDRCQLDPQIAETLPGYKEERWEPQNRA